MTPRIGRPGCNPAEHPNIGRRQFIQAGSLTLLGTSLADLLRLEAQAVPAFETARIKAKSIVFIFQGGGPSQHETWDPKPEAPDGIRGEYGTIPTSTEGFRICEHLPRLSQRAHKYSIVRTMHHPAEPQFRSEHVAAQYMLQTGTTTLPSGETTNTIGLPNPRRFEWPSIGSMIAYAAPGSSNMGLPPVIDLPRGSTDGAGQRPGMLGVRYARWHVDLAPPCHAPDRGGSCPNCFSHDQPDDSERAPGKHPKAWYDNSSCRNPDFHLPSDLQLPVGVSLSTLEDRAALRQKLDLARRSLERSLPVDTLDLHQRQAVELVLAQNGKRNPFDLTQEPDAVRDLYGREVWGQAFLVARRLVEAGVRMVQVNMGGWDTHQNAFRDLKGKLLPSIDRCLSGFLDDLDARGLLDETLIVMCGEMGRTPRISPISATVNNAAGVPFTPGRHHWGDVFPCFFAGGGIRPGQVIGQSDKHGAYPVGEAYSAADLAATIFHQMGIGPDREFTDVDGRSYRIHQGLPIPGLV